VESELIPSLTRFLSFRTIAGANEEKRRCLEWIERTFLKSYKLPHLAKATRSRKAIRCQHGSVEGCPYLLLMHPEPKLLWFAHIDVIPGEESQFTLEREGDKLFGRGAKDMKGSCLPFFLAYREACQGGSPPPVSILITSDEETAGPTIPTLLKQGKLTTPIAYTPDTGSTPDIVVECKGVVWADLIAQGKGTHSALPWEGENPTLLLSKALQKLAEDFPAGTVKDWQVTVTPTMLQGSDARNKVPAEARCSLDIRYPPECCSTPEEALELVQAHLPAGCKLSPFLSAPPLSTKPDHSLIERMKRIAEEIVGDTVKIGREHGSTDARSFSAAGIPAFLYGPEGGGIHGQDEWVSLASLKQHLTINRQFLQEL
jgi:succinyl-diaminopimelate desuccinylase